MADSDDILHRPNNRWHLTGFEVLEVSRLSLPVDTWIEGEQQSVLMAEIEKGRQSGGQLTIDSETADTVVMRYVAPGTDLRITTPKDPALGPKTIPSDQLGPK